ncbi:MAG: hypothetical protein LLG06_16465 [Desulfobacteraceae bacterium]|nr:hypothetical protein [Desulfobacteraceae bacterium]
MQDAIRKLQREAERIASKHPLPEFYTRFKAQAALARRLFYSHPGVVRLRQAVEPLFHEELGHGLYHSSRVSIDCAALLCIETDSDRMKPIAVERLMTIGIYSGLLHDICRDTENHAEIGATEAERILCDFHISKNEIACICNAIRNHEAFLPPKPTSRRWMQLASDCLYDADKFRWGADTFTHTLWHMVDHKGLSPHDLLASFPWGMSGTLRIKETFRTQTGRQYGPEIIDTGVEIGKEIYRHLLKNFRENTRDSDHAG